MELRVYLETDVLRREAHVFSRCQLGQKITSHIKHVAAAAKRCVDEYKDWLGRYGLRDKYEKEGL